MNNDIANPIYQQETVKDDSINLYANIDINCSAVPTEYDPVRSWKVIDSMDTSRTTAALRMNNENSERSAMKMSEKLMSFGCHPCKSLPTIRFFSKSTIVPLPHSSKSLPSCLTLFQKHRRANYSFYQKRSSITVAIQKSKINVLSIVEKKKSDPTIGELLGDDDEFRYYYNTRHCSLRYEGKRSRYYHRTRPVLLKHRSRSRSPLDDETSIRIPPRQQSYQQPISMPSDTVETLPTTNPMFVTPAFYPSSYDCTPLASYYYYSTLFSLCPFSIVDPYTGMPPPQETSYRSIDNYHHRKHSRSRHRDKQSPRSSSHIRRQHQNHRQ